MKDLAESLEAEPYVHPASDKEEKVGRGTELLLAWIRAGRELTSGQRSTTVGDSQRTEAHPRIMYRQYPPEAYP